MDDCDAPFDSVSDDADAAAALFELAAPDLPPPTSLRREPAFDPEIAVWTVHAKGVVLRMKVAVAEAAAARVHRGAARLGELASRGLRVPESLRVRARPGGSPATIALERRLGTSSAAVGWPMLGAPGRVALAEAFAGALHALHALRPPSRETPPLLDRPPGRAVAAGGGGADAPASIPWRAPIEARVVARVAALRDAGVLEGDAADGVEVRMLDAAASLPDTIAPATCHGGLTLSAAALARRTFAGLADFESSCGADPWLDVAAAVEALGGPLGAPARRFLEVYASAVAPPSDLATRLELYTGLVMLRALSFASARFPVEARAAAEHWLSTDRLPDRLPDDRLPDDRLPGGRLPRDPPSTGRASR